MNAAIPQGPPQVDYWAVNAGDGARLDGKTPTALKDKDGNEVDIRKLRAEAAARRAEAAAASSTKLMASSGKNLQGEEIPPDEEAAKKAAASALPKSKRKSKIGSKYSRLKQSGAAFQGSANNLK